jgi:hypothetical protein
VGRRAKSAVGEPTRVDRGRRGDPHARPPSARLTSRALRTPSSWKP